MRGEGECAVAVHQEGRQQLFADLIKRLARRNNPQLHVRDWIKAKQIVITCHQQPNLNQRLLRHIAFVGGVLDAFEHVGGQSQRNAVCAGFEVGERDTLRLR